MCLALASPSHVKHCNIVSQKVQIIPQRLIACNRFFIKLGLHRVYLNYVGMLIYIPFTNFSEDGSASQRAEPKYDSRGIAIPPPSRAVPFSYFSEDGSTKQEAISKYAYCGISPRLRRTALFPFFLRTAQQVKGQNLSMTPAGLRSRLRHT